MIENDGCKIKKGCKWMNINKKLMKCKHVVLIKRENISYNKEENLTTLRIRGK